MSRPFRIGILWLGLTAAAGFAGGETNRYARIAQKNLFALKAKSVAPVPASTTALATAKIKLVGFAAIAPHKWAVLQVRELGKAAVMLTLKEGGAEGLLEVLEVDAPAQRVRIRQAGVVMTITFDDDVRLQKMALARLEAEHQPLPTLPPPDAGDL